jgi:hypothetical protein
MRTPASVIALVAVVTALGATPVPVHTQTAVLRDVKTIDVLATVVPNPSKVKEDFAPVLVQDALRKVLEDARFAIGPGEVTAHIVLEEFTSGSTAKRLLVGFGAGRSSVAGRLVFTAQDGRELATVRIKARGNALFAAYQGGDRQRAQATSGFEQKLMEQVARLK